MAVLIRLHQGSCHAKGRQACSVKAGKEEGRTEKAALLSNDGRTFLDFQWQHEASEQSLAFDRCLRDMDPEMVR